MSEKLVTPYIDSQFPAYYRENYPIFVEFVKMYYSWLQQEDQAVGAAKRLDLYRDVDLTKEEFLIYFKNKYLPLLKFVTKTDKRTIIKHVQDLYRSKGTERSIDLFFKLVYGAPADVYYPSTDLFKLSDNRWVKKSYLEVSCNYTLREFIGKRVIGKKTGAEAFVEQFAIKKVGPKYAYVLYLSNVTGDFETSEEITYPGLETDRYPIVVGSLTSLDITQASEGFSVGDIVTVYSESGGSGALARVANVFSTTGLVDFKLVDGGWGYSDDAQVYVSSKNLTLDKVVPDVTINNRDSIYYNSSPYFNLEVASQKLANLDCMILSGITDLANIAALTTLTAYSATNSVLATVKVLDTSKFSSANLSVDVDTGIVDFSSILDLTTLTAYSATNSVLATVKVLSSDQTNTTSGNLFVRVLSGNGLLNTYYWSPGNTYSINVTAYADKTDASGSIFVHVDSGNAQLNSYFWSPGNTYSVNAVIYEDKTATGMVVGSTKSITAYVSNSTAQFSRGQSLYQLSYVNGDPNAPYVSATANISGAIWGGSSGTLNLTDVSGAFRPTVNVYMAYANGSNSGSKAYLNSYNGVVGVANVSGEFTSIGNSAITFLTSNTRANVVQISTGQNAGFSVGNSSTFSYPEQVSIYTDLIGGTNSTSMPYIDLGLSDLAWGFPASPSGNSGSVIADLLQTYTGNIGGITALTAVNPGEDYNSSPFVYVVDPYIASFDKRDYLVTIQNVTGIFSVGEEVTQTGGGKGLIKSANATHMSLRRISFGQSIVTGSTLTGSFSGATAQVTSVTSDSSSLRIGADAIVSANVKSAAGAVSSLEIIDSGYNFVDKEDAVFASADGSRVGAAKVNLVKQGISRGSYYDESSFLSANKYLFDGYYYQEYSYDVRVPVPKEVFEENFMQTMHVAGTKMFSTFEYSSKNDTKINVFLPEGTANTLV